MPSSFTSRLKLERQASGENSGTWGNLVNYVFNRVDASVSGYQAVPVGGSANVTLTSNNSTSNTDDDATDDQVHNATLEFTGTLTGDIHVFTDAVEQNYVVFNNTSGSQSLTFANTGHAANGVVLKQGAKTIVYTDGSSVFDVNQDLADIKATSVTSNGAVSGTTITGSANVAGTNIVATANTVDMQGSAPNVIASGGTNTDINLSPKGYGLVTFNGGGKIQQVNEKVNTSATAATGTINFDALDGAVQNFTTNASANWTFNLRGNSSVTLNNYLDSGESITVAHIVPQGSTAYYANVVQIDGSTVTPKWQGGAPSEGTANSTDTYTYTAIKTGANTYTVLASLTAFE
jgi:hypothetical protein|tara:strand:- start:721 stop:1764 length:1044 start_codon:yes stop_codon:yes gene_type:complete